jgi:hypothetical protein
MILLLVAVVLGGCSAGGAPGAGPCGPDADAEPDHHPGLGPAPAGRHRPRLPGVRGHPQQYQLIGQRVHEVIVRQQLWDQGVRFGAGVNQGKYLVLIDPGLSGLTARQILNRLLGNP